jgi:predicted  nucleic acid-binding Zn-ribbon protein
MHTNPFSDVGYDLADIKRQLSQKADNHEILTLRSHVDSLEHALREASSEIDGLRSRCERLEEAVRELNPGLAI